ncbi:acyltransferase family protein [Tuberibacillus sp. Marseille-P3662]|uniref:acyltransferase family protein n=1 Tax=Tuberibacillus sp. Marseille-P3662 TaxID=1965358 RepID=UPI001593A6BC|nr:acyltransferase family protein [Tuberibacillus sp. Marseille-P3662]
MQQRSQYFDNAKFLLIFFVVFGHIISPLKNNSDFLFAVYKFIYLFHMPAFILIAGHFAKGYDKPGYFKKIFKKTLAPYIIFQVIYSFFYYVMGYEDTLTLTLLDPHWSLWFLMSLFSWYVLLKVSKGHPMMVPLSFIVGIAVGYFDIFDSVLSIERTLIFFPFFILGHHLSREQFAALGQKHWRSLATIALCLILVACFFMIPDAAKDWLWGSASYNTMGVGGWLGACYRMMFYMLMLTATFGVLALIPRGSFSFTKLGSYTLYIYLLHGFFIKTIKLLPFYKNMEHLTEYLLLFCAAIAICYLLGSGPVRQLAKPLIELKRPKPKQPSDVST